MLYQPKTYQINLDLDPSERWTAIGKDYAEHVQALLKVVVGVVNKIDDNIVPFILKVTFKDKLTSWSGIRGISLHSSYLEFAKVGGIFPRKLCR